MAPDPATSILSDVRASCAHVTGVADHVHVVGDVHAYAHAYDLDAVRKPTYDTDHHFRGDPADTVAYVLALDAVNFGSGWFPYLAKRPGMSGYFTIASRLTDRFEAHGPLSADELAQISTDAVARIFMQPLDVPERVELMEHFTEAWRQLGALLAGRYQGEPTRLVGSAEHRAEKLIHILGAMPYFRDVAKYHGRKVPFYKRAQITASDLALALDGEGWGRFDDLDELTIFADNLVPHVLRVDGLLGYDDHLTNLVERGEPLTAGSVEEIEIRAVALDAVEQMVAALRAGGVEVSARELDVAIWNRGLDPRYRKAPRHRTRTVYY